MSEASLAAQRLAVTKMRAHAPLLALCPKDNIMDRNARPEIFPCILLGEGQTVDESATCIVAAEVFLTIHVWTKENTMAGCKSISGEVQRALRNAEGVQDGWALDFTFDDAVYLRDPSGEHSHAVVTFSVMAEDTLAGAV